MIKKLSIGFLLAISVVAIQAQSQYSQENLENASLEELSIFLTQAQKMKKTGGVLLIVAPISATVGVFLWTTAWSGGSEGQLTAGTGLILASLVSTAVGIPVRITGSSRVKKVSDVWNAKQNTAIIDMGPCSIYNLQTQQLQPGFRLRITF